MDGDDRKGSPFSAADPTLGYLYQVRSALLWALRRLKTEADFTLSLETLDDVTFETVGGEATDLLQTKHHLARQADLTDYSVDLWKTLRVWFEGDSSGQIPKTTKLYLLTTSIAAEGSAASRLRAKSRDESAAQQALESVALSSTSDTNKKAYQAYLREDSSDRIAILKRVVVLDASPTIESLDEELQQEIYWAVSREHHESFLERIEGWWLRRVIHQLAVDRDDRIGSGELEAKMSDLREQFTQESLPIDDDLLDFTLDDATAAAHEDYIFVRQLEIIAAGKRRVAAAIRDYLRAYEQRSRWLREELLFGFDLHKYEKRLVEEWELVFEAMVDELGAGAADEAKRHAARSVLAWAERVTIPIRPSVIEPFVSRGSLHMLSDEIRVGWHPDFRDLLERALGVQEGVE